MTHFGDDDLHAYVDGQLAPDRAAQVESWLEDHPEAAEKVRLWLGQNEGLHRLFDGVMDEPVPERLRPSVLAAHRRGPVLAMAMRAAAAAALLILGGMGGWLARGEGEAASIPWTPAVVASDAMSAHVVFAAEIRHPVEVAAADRAHLVAWLSKRLGTSLKVPDLAPAGFDLMGGRLLPASGGPAAQFMYESRSGRRLTLYLRKGEAGGDTSFRLATQDGVEAFYWMDGPFGYALVADLPRDQLLPLAKAVYQQLTP